jgi:signal peptidase I
MWIQIIRIKKPILFISLLLSLSGCQLYPQQTTAVVQPTLPANLSCVEYADVRTLSGSSLSPALLSGDQLLFLGGYYGCNSVKYGDLVLYRWGDNKNVAKFVRGLSGDLLAVQEISPNQWRIELNGQPLYNSLGAEYILSEKKAALIRLYARRLKANEVLLLGNNANGSHDSTVFGLVTGDQLSGKLIFLRHSHGN